MSVPRPRFGDFVLDAANRSLHRDGVPVSINARYFDALVLLVREQGRLVAKQRFFDEVWAGSVVTDAALTQCIKDIRRVLGDDANAPRYIRTVPGHGYCFIAAVSDDQAAPIAVEAASSESRPVADRPADPGLATALPRGLVDVGAATLGGAVSGLAGGLLYGSALAFSPQAQGLGTLSVLLVLLMLSVAVGMAGAFGVSLGWVAGRGFGPGPAWLLAGGAVGGFMVGGLAKLLGSDAFTLLVGQAPAGITGGLEGAVIGFALTAGLHVGGGMDAASGPRPAWFAALATGLAGALLPLAGGSLMATSLARVAATFDDSRLDMTPLGRLFGEPQFGALAQAALGAVEGGMFGGLVAAALLFAHRRRR